MTLRGHTDWVNRVSFTLDGTKLNSRTTSGEPIVWDVSTGNRLDDALWKEAVHPKVSPNGKWLETSSGNGLLLVDLEFKNNPREKAFREAKSRPTISIKQVLETKRKKEGI